MPEQRSISGVGFYFGLQTNVTILILHTGWQKGTDILQVEDSRFEERQSCRRRSMVGLNPLDTKATLLGCGGLTTGAKEIIESAMLPDGLDSDGEWFGLWITDLDSNETTWIGSLKFPLLNGAARIEPRTVSLIELYGWPEIRPIDMPQWHVSAKRPLGDNIEAERGYAWYPWDDSDNALFNSDVRYDHSEDRAHLIIGGTTERKTPPERLIGTH